MTTQAFILPDERHLFARVVLGDEAAFTKIFYHYSARIFPFIQKITRSEEATEEIVQDVFLSIWKNRESLSEIENYQSWIFTIATNLSYNYLKSKARRQKRLTVLPLNEEDSTNNTLETIDYHDSRQLINNIVEQMPQQRKLIYKMSRVDGLTHEEIAEKLNISKSTVKNQMIEALKFIKSELQKSPGTSLTLVSIFITIYS